MNNQECRVRPKTVDVNNNGPVFFPYSVKTSNCSGSGNNINHPHAKLCVPDVVRNLNVKVFNLMSITNETRHIKWHETCKCKCRLDASVHNHKQRWNDDKCRCELKELVSKRVCDKGFISNSSNCECECNKSCDIGEYLDYENCKCRKKLIDKLVEERTENVEEVKLAQITLAEHENVLRCSSFTLFIVLFSIIFKVSVGIGTYFVYVYFVYVNLLLINGKY